MRGFYQDQTNYRNSRQLVVFVGLELFYRSSTGDKEEIGCEFINGLGHLRWSFYREV